MDRPASRSVLRAFARIGADPADDDDLRQQKALFVSFACAVIPVTFGYGLVYWVFGEHLAAVVPWTYDVLSAAIIGVFAATRRFRPFRLAERLLILLLPAMLMVALGGFVPSSAVILWSLIAPIGAIVFDGPRVAWRWFAAYAGILVLAGVLGGAVRPVNNLPELLVIGLFIVNIGVVSTYVFALLATFARQRAEALGLVRVEQARSENLLLNILPAPIAQVLKRESRTIADHFDSASVLFADVVDFTTLAAQLRPTEVVEVLNNLFTEFDALVERHSLEKIKTIGDAYMVASGVPEPRPDHALGIAALALDMQATVARQAPVAGRRLELRIGIASGPVVAGVIGRKRFTYDLWGDTVNVASRMESHGSAGRIQVTRATYELISDDFVCEPRGSIEVKGKGPTETWFLIRPRLRKMGSQPDGAPDDAMGQA